ncbi:MULTISPECIES: hypothetical protein [unclassified Exiguobacterium]|uniref:hypothetical protein n=1 Tax=unclassified Exiguobacterium TaxID=2644629 RepID=UPI0025B987C0|nr:MULTISPECIES: hypothetical protein [unclassified Exiguobacterium]
MSLLNKLLQDPVVSEIPRLHNALLAKERGLRKEWLVHIDEFIEEANAWDFERQRTFVNLLLSTCEGESDVSVLLIHPIQKRLLKPILNQWMKELPDDVRPYRWYGLFFDEDDRFIYLQEAITRGGRREQLAIERMIDHHLYGLWYSFHHLDEDLYLGEIEEDAAFLTEAQLLIEQLDDVVFKSECIIEWQKLNQTLTYWVRFREEHTTGFMEWRMQQELKD